MTEVNIDTATTIESYVFYGCISLTKVTIGSQVTTIGGSAFSRCTGLTSITLPEGLTSIENSAFSGCRGLTEINYNATNLAEQSVYRNWKLCILLL